MEFQDTGTMTAIITEPLNFTRNQSPIVGHTEPENVTETLLACVQTEGANISEVTRQTLIETRQVDSSSSHLISRPMK